MINSGPASRPVAVSAKFQSLVRFTGCFGLVIALLATVAATPPSQLNPDEQYIHIMAVIDRADALRKSGQAEAARAKYIEAEKALLAFKAANPLFDPRTVAYRLKEVSDQVDVRPNVPETNSVAKPKANLEAEPAAAKSSVKLLEAGAEPRSVLRYHVKAGDKQTAIFTIKAKQETPVPAAGQNPATPAVPSSPAISIPLDITVQSVAANGDITYQTVMGEAILAQDTNTPPEVVQGIQPLLAGIKGITGTTVMSSRGSTKKTDVKVPTSANPLVRQFVDQIKQAATSLSAEVPEEAVGAGAKWEVKQPVKTQSATVDKTATYEMTSLEGDKFMVKYVESSDKDSAAGLNSSVSGTATADLSKAVSSVEMHMHIEAPMGRDKNTIVKQDVTILVEAQ